jgi:hypothetical protein
MSSVAKIIQRSISPSNVRVIGPLTKPRSYGVYRLPQKTATGRHYRYGNHPVRMHELEREFGSCKLEYLFAARADAKELAVALSDQ